MPVYMIGYDLNKAGKNYDDLHEAIQSLGSWWHCLDSTWLVVHSGAAIDIARSLVAHIDDDDTLLVSKIDGSDTAWAGFSEECVAWLNNNL